MAKQIQPEDLVLHFLNVGFGDNIVVEFPADIDGRRIYGIVDCLNSSKTIDYLDALNANAGQEPSQLAFICATHPHHDHIKGIPKVMDSVYCPKEFWDSGFRHKSLTYKRILDKIVSKRINMRRVTSGMEWYFERVRITALAPSIMLRNRYATYGVDMNNASIVLRIEHNKEDSVIMQSREYTGTSSEEAVRSAGKSVAILAGDAEFDSWAQISVEFPKTEKTKQHNALIKKMINYLKCSVLKVAHHGSMHSAPLDIYEKLDPNLAIISTVQKVSTKKVKIGSLTRILFPHESSIIALEEIDAKVLTTDGSYESMKLANGKEKDPTNAHPGTIVVVIPPGGKPRSKKLGDITANDFAIPEQVI